MQRLADEHDTDVRPSVGSRTVGSISVGVDQVVPSKVDASSKSSPIDPTTRQKVDKGQEIATGYSDRCVPLDHEGPVPN